MIPTNKELFMKVCNICADKYVEKDTRYESAFSRQFEEDGLKITKMRLDDKVTRLKALVKDPTLQTDDESIVDTLIDNINYSVMTLMEMIVAIVKDEKEESKNG